VLPNWAIVSVGNFVGALPTGLLIRAAGTYQNVVDGGPAARFGAELRHLIENAIALRAA
jgi:hypothetical protein